VLPDIRAEVAAAPGEVRVLPDILAAVGAAPGDDSTLPDIRAEVLVDCRSTDPLSLAAVAIS